MEKKRALTQSEIDDICEFLTIQSDKDFEIEYEIFNNIKQNIIDQLCGVEIYPSMIPKLKEKIKKDYYNSRLHPGSSVGVLASLSIGEVSTQNTLNSIDYSEIVALIDNKNCGQITKIGEFIDNLIETAKKNNPEKVEFHAKNHTEYLPLPNGYFIPSVDEDGKMHWKRIEAVTRHDPPDDNVLLRVTTATGRSVIATPFLSFLIRKNNKIVPINGSELKVGDRMPISIVIPEPETTIDSIDLGNYLSKSEYIFGTDMWLAKKFRDDNKLQKRKKGYSWFDENGKSFTVPYKRSDVAMVALEGVNKCNVGKEYIQPKFIYNKFRGHSEIIYKIPVQFPLDELFGFFIGAFLAEGHLVNTGNQVAISNNDENYRKRIIEFCEKFGFGYHIQVSDNRHRFSNSVLQYDVRIHSTLLVKLMHIWCGNYSHLKFIPHFCVNSNKKFLRGIIDGYFSGDGWISKKSLDIKSSSVSEKLIDGLIFILNRFNIYARKNKPKLVTKNNVGSKNILQAYHITINNKNSIKFANEFKMVIDYKQKELNRIKNVVKTVFDYSKHDKTPIVLNKTEFVYSRSELRKQLIKEKNLKNTLEIKKALDTEVVFDPIVKLEKVESSTKYVYDFTVSDTRYFAVINGVNFSDTFHHSGTASSALVNSGTSRFNELLNASKKQKSNIMNIELKQSTNSLSEIRDYCRANFEERYIDDLVDDKHDYTENRILTSSEKIWYNFFDEFVNTKYKECTWSIRLQFNKLKIYQHKIDIQHVASLIESQYTDCFCVWSPQEICIIDVYINPEICDPHEIVELRNKLYNKRKNTSLDDVFRNHIDSNNKHYYFIRDLAIVCIMNICVTGICGIENCFYTKDYSTNKWIIQTQGTNMRNVINRVDVDFTKIISNNMWEIYSILGIEATRKFLLSEIRQNVGTSVDIAHVSMLVDSMTVTGKITSTNRYGISRASGPLTKSSFEQSRDNMLLASTNGEKDDLSTVSASIIMGKRARIGTGMVDLYTNTNMLKEISVENEIQDSESELDY